MGTMLPWLVSSSSDPNADAFLVTLFDPGPAERGLRVRMIVAYDGSGFSGFAAQPGRVTIAGCLAAAITQVTGSEVAITCAGRTDAGVHARAQVVHFDLVPGTSRGRPLDVEGLARSVNKLLAPAVVVRGADLAPEGFHARHSAQWRSYRYLIDNTPVPDPFLARIAWHVGSPLDLRAMSAACDAVLGEHDFSTFCRKPPSLPDASLVRRVIDARWRHEGQGRLCLDIEASSFCHQMVRSLVGTMVEIGRGRRRAGDVSWMIRARDRSVAPSPAPPHGLCLWAVGYPPEWQPRLFSAPPRATRRTVR